MTLVEENSDKAQKNQWKRIWLSPSDSLVNLQSEHKFFIILSVPIVPCIEARIKISGSLGRDLASKIKIM